MQHHAGKDRGRLLVENRLTETEQCLGEIEGRKNSIFDSFPNQPEADASQPDSEPMTAARGYSLFLQSRRGGLTTKFPPPAKYALQPERKHQNIQKGAVG